MIHISDGIASVEVTVGSKQQNFGTNCTEEESEDKNYVRIKNSFCC